MTEPAARGSLCAVGYFPPEKDGAMMATMRSGSRLVAALLLSSAACKHGGWGAIGRALSGVGHSSSSSSGAAHVATAAASTAKAASTAATSTAKAAASAAKAGATASKAAASAARAVPLAGKTVPVAHPIGSPPLAPPSPVRRPPRIVNADPVLITHFGDGSAFFWNVGLSYHPDHGGSEARGDERNGPAQVSLLGVWPAAGEGALRSPRSTLLELIAEAQALIDVAAPDLGEGGGVEPLLWALQEAADRGVRVRVLVDDRAAQSAVDALAGHRGIEVRTPREPLPSTLWSSYLVIDRGEACLAGEALSGDSRGAELGLLLRAPASVRALEDVFDTDWAQAGAPGGTPIAPPSGGYRLPESAVSSSDPARDPSAGRLALTPVFTPRGRLPAESLWARPALISLLDSARVSLSLRVAMAGEDPLEATLLAALERASRRGVRVQVLALDRTGDPDLTSLRSLSSAASLRLRSARAASSALSLIVADGQRAWLGSGGLGLRALGTDRNAGVISEGPSLAGELDRFFAAAWLDAAGPVAFR